MVQFFARSSILVALVLTSVVAGCSSSDSSDGKSSSSGGSSGSSSGSSGTSGNNGGGCTGDIANCAVGTLSDAQQDDMCSILAAAIDDPPGTKLECTEGGNNQYIVVNSKADCVAQHAKPTCKVTVTQLVGCFKAAKKDACGAFGNDGACKILFDPTTGCL
jgi:hypothetical protein